MNTQEAKRTLVTAIRARTPIIAVSTPEELRVMETIREMASEPIVNTQGQTIVPYRLVFTWSVTGGLRLAADPPEQHSPEFGMPPDDWTQLSHPSDALQEYTAWAAAQDVSADVNDRSRRARAVDERTSVLIMQDVHRFLASPDRGGENDILTMRWLRDSYATLRSTKSVIVLLAPSWSDLGDAERDTLKIDWPLPSIEELADMVRDAGERVAGRIPVDLNGNTEKLARTLAALTWAEAERTLSMAIVQAEALSVEACADIILAQKAEILRRQRGLKLIQPEEGLDDVGGLEILKEDMAGLDRLLSQEAKANQVETPRAILLAGPPGTGKTLSAKVMGRAANLPVLVWSVGETHSKYVGESAEFTADVLAAADAINSCILVLDEVDTQLAEGSEGDSKAHAEVLGMVLNWIQEKTSDVVVVMTTNHPERLREALVDRCDRAYHVGYPGRKACSQIIGIHARKRGISLDGAEIDNLARIAAQKSLAGRNIEDAIRVAHSKAFLAGEETTASHIKAVLTRTRGLAEKRPQEAQAIHDWCSKECQPASKPEEAEAVAETAGLADLDV